MLTAALAAPAAHAEGGWPLCRPWSITSQAPATPIPEGTTVLEADEVEAADDGLLLLEGGVTVLHRRQRLEAERALFDRQRDWIEAGDAIRLDTPELILLGHRAEFDLEAERGLVLDNRYFLPPRHTRGAAERVTLEGREVTILEGASLTTCDPGDEGWAIRASTLRLDHRAGIGSAFNARVEFQGVPFLYFPYLRFPITGERTTGLLAPSFGSSTSGGNELALPFYWNIHPQLDATITPHNYTERGLRWITEVRYLSRLGTTVVEAERIDDAVFGGRRSLYRLNHRGSLGAGWGADIAYVEVSDPFYLTDFGTALGTTSVTHLERHARFDYRFDSGRAMIRWQDYQTLDETIPEASRPYRRLPQITLDYGGGERLRYGIDSEWVRFQRRDRLMADRLDLLAHLALPLEREEGFLIPKVSLRHTRYAIDPGSASRDDYRPARTVPTFSLDGGLFLERDTALGSLPLVQTLEPRLFYLYTPYREQADLPRFDTGQSALSLARLFAENRFNGPDRVGDADQLTVALTTRLLERDSGRERLRATVGQILYFEDRRVGLGDDVLETRNHSDVLAEARLQLTRHLGFSAELVWSPEYDLFTKRYLKLQYKRGGDRIVNVGYRFQGNHVTDPDRIKREIDLSALWPLNSRWSMIARRYHSLEQDRTLEKLLGLEYESCCWTFRLVRRALRSQSATDPEGDLRYSWMAQLELKGLTSIGKRIEQMMEESIVGYSAVGP